MLPFVFVHQMGMKRPYNEHSRRKRQEHTAHLSDGDAQLLSHHKRQHRKKHIDGCE